MSQSDRAIKKLATQLARLDREVKSWRGAQADYTSIEAGTMDINDSDGNLVSRVGYQEDGSGATRFFDGPIPPVPSGVTASADGPIIQATWDGSFEGGAEATYDLAYLEVAATLVDDDQNVSFATITAKEGASASVVADVTGDWVVAVRSVSQAGKKSEFATAGTVEVKLTDVAGAIEAVQDSANGKNKVTYSSHAPTENDPGIFDDTWFVGQVGRPNDVVEATNFIINGNFANGTSGWAVSPTSTLTADSTFAERMWADSFGYQASEAPMARATLGSTSLNMSQVNNSFTGTGFVAFSALVASESGAEIRSTIGFRDASGSSLGNVSSEWATADYYDGRRVLHVAPIPTGTGQITVQLNFRGAAGNRMWVDRVMAVCGESEASAIAHSETYFDGDTEDGATPNESHYRWTGTPHASPSEKYLPALDIGESSNWNIIEQYRHDGNGWVKVELSHYVFSTVDLGKATVGELDGIRIMARTITGDLFSGDAFDGVVFRGNTFVTRDGNGEFSDRGLFFQKPDGTAIFRVPTDGTPISMSASDVQIERAQVDELDLNVGRVRSGGLLELSSGVTPPASPPELNAAWKRVTTLPAVDSGVSVNGFTAWGDKWLRALNVRSVAEGDRIEIYNNDGEFEQQIPLTMNPHFGVTVLGNVCYVLGHQHGRPLDEKRVHGYDLTTGERVTSWVMDRFYASDQKPISLGNDGTNVLVAGVTPTPRLYVMRYNPTTGAQVGSDMVASSESTYPFSVTGVWLRDGKLYVCAAEVVREYEVVDGSWSLARFAWWNPARDGAGFVFVDGKPFVVDGSGTIFEGSTRSSDYTAEVCYTWYDGTYETTPSPVATINVAARETITISLPYREGLQKRVYTREGERWRRNTIAPETTVADIHTGVIVYVLPTTNSFPAADPAVLRTTNNTFRVRGDGSGKWGPLTFNADGTMTGIRQTSSGTLTVSAPSGGGTTDTWVTFPEGRFTKAPTVTTSLRSTAPNSASVSTGGATATGFYIYFYRVNDNATGVNWIATEEG